MRTLLTLAMVSVMALTLTSCGSAKVNDLKVKTASTVGAAVEKELNEEYASLSIEKDCVAEAKMEGEKVKAKILDLLKAKEELASANLTTKSFATAGGVVPVLCQYVISTILPQFIQDEDSKYACLRAIGSAKIEKVGSDLCSAIDI